MGKFAEGTSVSADRSRAEIEQTLKRYGADAFGYMHETERAVIMFRIEGKHVRFILPIPKVEEFRYTPNQRQYRSDSQMRNAHEQAVKQRWRALNLVIKAKLEAVESKIVTLEDEFLAHIVLPDNQTVSQWIRPQIEQAYMDGKMPTRLLLSSGE
jgi:hypothetical protein